MPTFPLGTVLTNQMHCRIRNDIGFLVGQTATVQSVMNLGTKKRPVWRYQLDNGLWCDDYHFGV